MKIAVLLSGGVDSSVALNLLREQGGHDITAFYLKIWLEEEFAFLGECPWEDDLKYARAVCDQAGVPLKVVSLQREYWDRVVSHTIAELKAGRTPSPDILCNQRVKFGAFCDHIDATYDKIATGHYARVAEIDGRFWLKKGIDPIKDQTYFLSHLSQEQLARCLFPVGEYPKKEVRELAKRFDLPNRDRPDSQGICFLGKIKYNEFVKAHLGTRTGDIRELETDKKLGDHDGFWFHTIGQRKGLGLGGGPWYVVKKDIKRNIVYVSRNESRDERSRFEFDVAAINWITAPPQSPQLSVKLRHGERTIPCQLEGLNDLRGHVTLQQGDPGIAPGQYAVFYDDEICLGGGIIDF